MQLVDIMVQAFDIYDSFMSNYKYVFILSALFSFSPTASPEANRYIRLSFAYYEKEQLHLYTTQLGHYINQCMQK